MTIYFILSSPKSDRKVHNMFKLFRKTRDFDELQLMYWMRSHNRGKIKIMPTFKDKPAYLRSSVPLEQLTLPRGWIYISNHKYLTNEFSNTLGTYSYVEIDFR